MACCSVQICDLMTLEERRDGWNGANLSYAPQYVERARIAAIAAWNTRAGQSASAAEIAARDAEIARLREALGRIVNVRVDRDADNIWAGRDRCAAIARAALNEGDA